MSGADFLKFKRIDLEDFIRYAKHMVDNTKWLMTNYESAYTPEQIKNLHGTIAYWEKEKDYAEQELAQMGGAENEKPILTGRSKRSESPQLERISCTTVL